MSEIKIKCNNCKNIPDKYLEIDCTHHLCIVCSANSLNLEKKVIVCQKCNYINEIDDETIDHLSFLNLKKIKENNLKDIVEDEKEYNLQTSNFKSKNEVKSNTSSNENLNFSWKKLNWENEKIKKLNLDKNKENEKNTKKNYFSIKDKYNLIGNIQKKINKNSKEINDNIKILNKLKSQLIKAKNIKTKYINHLYNEINLLDIKLNNEINNIYENIYEDLNNTLKTQKNYNYELQKNIKESYNNFNKKIIKEVIKNNEYQEIYKFDLNMIFDEKIKELFENLENDNIFKNIKSLNNSCLLKEYKNESITKTDFLKNKSKSFNNSFNIKNILKNNKMQKLLKNKKKTISFLINKSNSKISSDFDTLTNNKVINKSLTNNSQNKNNNTKIRIEKLLKNQYNLFKKKKIN